MGLSINPVSLVEAILKRRERSRDQVANFLDEVAEDARTLAEIWDVVITELTTGTGRFSRDRTHEMLRAEFWGNVGPFFRLREFYNQFSTTMEGKLDEEVRENVMNHLGLLLNRREITQRTFHEAMEHIKVSVFVETDNSLDQFRDLSTLSVALHKEAAALTVLAKSFRVTQG